MLTYYTMHFAGGGWLFFIKVLYTKCFMPIIFRTELLTPLPNLWPNQYIYVCINEGVYSCKFRY